MTRGYLGLCTHSVSSAKLAEQTRSQGSPDRAPLPPARPPAPSPRHVPTSPRFSGSNSSSPSAPFMTRPSRRPRGVRPPCPAHRTRQPPPTPSPPPPGGWLPGTRPPHSGEQQDGLALPVVGLGGEEALAQLGLGDLVSPKSPKPCSPALSVSGGRGRLPGEGPEAAERGAGRLGAGRSPWEAVQAGGEGRPGDGGEGREEGDLGGPSPLLQLPPAPGLVPGVSNHRHQSRRA